MWLLFVEFSIDLCVNGRFLLLQKRARIDVLRCVGGGIYNIVIVLDGFGVAGDGSFCSSPSANNFLKYFTHFGMVYFFDSEVLVVFIMKSGFKLQCMILPLPLVSSGLEFMLTCFGFEVSCLIHSQQSLLYSY
ncbi:hypothetical protein T4D_5626 [Trichinella pseudospiralis]|uniref:Uncharacterized protein n=1 Tax=Trichinella pseudospiralis TaxID=6337 RepID=A0A0V1FM58_TRIPS|nr:hypothetical protein T4D_5626 [Trichinella pseudospiralis]